MATATLPRPTEWTYGGRLDWSSEDTICLAPVGMVLYCLFEAIRERLGGTITYNGNIVSFSWLFPTMNLKLAPYWTSYYHYVELIEQKVETLINSGYWLNGASYPTPASVEGSEAEWTDLQATKDGVLDALGYDDLLTINDFGPITKEWVIQKYRIINALTYKISSWNEQNKYYKTAEWYATNNLMCDDCSTWYTEASMRSYLNGELASATWTNTYDGYSVGAYLAYATDYYCVGNGFPPCGTMCQNGVQFFEGSANQYRFETIGHGTVYVPNGSSTIYFMWRIVESETVFSDPAQEGDYSDITKQPYTQLTSITVTTQTNTSAFVFEDTNVQYNTVPTPVCEEYGWVPYGGGASMVRSANDRVAIIDEGYKFRA